MVNNEAEVDRINQTIGALAFNVSKMDALALLLLKVLMRLNFLVFVVPKSIFVSGLS